MDEEIRQLEILFRLGDTSKVMEEGRLYEPEIFWRDHYLWLQDKGYLLRPRYHPDWVASWKDDPAKDYFICEDGQLSRRVFMMMDAIRIEDGKQIMLKKVVTSKHPDEATIGRLFSSETHASHPSNRCVPIYDVFSIPDEEGTVILVMPFLMDWKEPDFDTVGEFVEFVKQVFEGLQFMHILHMAHNDVKWDNVMMDSLHLYDEPIHVTDSEMKRDYSGEAKSPRSRTIRPVKYYHVDFGNARVYPPEQGAPRQYSGLEGYGGDLTVPEFKTPGHYDPFPIDVYRAGNLMREIVKGARHLNNKRFLGLEFMEPLLQDMCQDDPTKRPTMEEVVTRFQKIVDGLSSWKLRSRMRQQNVGLSGGFLGSVAHWTRQVYRIARRVPAIPRPPHC